MSDPNEMVVRCQCHVEALHLWRDDDGGVDVSMWKWKPYDGPTPWRQRLRHVWRILRRGEPFEDQVSLSPEDARRVGAWLLGGPVTVTFTGQASNTSASWTRTPQEPA